MNLPSADFDRVRELLRATFGYTSFRPLQEEIVATILRGEDAFVLMPTGGGKSLCYQLPALLRERPTVVVSPLIALMKDQVDALRALGVAAEFINSSLEPAEAARRQGALVRGDLRLVYVAPERLMTDGFLKLLAQADPVAFAIDEAHCISEWGHDFRPEYRELKRLRTLFPRASVAAFTATATQRVRADIRAQLGLENARAFQGSFNRPNLFYDVRPKADTYRHLLAFLRGRKRESGIIYCQSRQGTETLAAKLKADGFSAGAYHAGLESEARARRQEAFVRDDVRIIVATIAFGMGIDKPDVRFVVHYDLPRALENFYQESGRAGRDGEPADCLLFYSYADVIKYGRFLQDKGTEAERRNAQQQLRQMANWADSRDCRRRGLLAYFGEQLSQPQDPCCDICRDGVTAHRDDFTLEARQFLSCVRRTGQRFGAAHVVDVLRGVDNERIQRFGHHTLKVYGSGSARSVAEWREIAEELLREGYLRRVEEEYNALRLTEAGLAVLSEGTTVMLQPPRPRKAADRRAAPPALEEGVDPGLFEELRALRKLIADERKVPPYVIFHDAVLRRIAAERPRSRAALLRIAGVGERKAADFGDAFLALVPGTGTEPAAPPPLPRARAAASPQRVRRAEAASASEPMRGRNPGDTRPGKTATWLVTLQAFQAGQSLDEVARSRGLSRTTVAGHLADAIVLGEEIEVDRLLPVERRRAIEAAFEQAADGRLRSVMEILGDGYDWEELRLVQALLRRG